jgi:hypothetical protein
MVGGGSGFTRVFSSTLRCIKAGIIALAAVRGALEVAFCTTFLNKQAGRGALWPLIAM